MHWAVVFHAATVAGGQKNTQIYIINPLISMTTFWHILFTAKEELWFGDFGIPLFYFSKFLLQTKICMFFNIFIS
jgi:hypothetical protein